MLQGFTFIVLLLAKMPGVLLNFCVLPFERMLLISKPDWWWWRWKDGWSRECHGVSDTYLQIIWGYF